VGKGTHESVGDPHERGVRDVGSRQGGYCRGGKRDGGAIEGGREKKFN